MLYEFQLGQSAALEACNICVALGEGTVAERTCQVWFNRFRSGDKSMEINPGSDAMLIAKSKNCWFCWRAIRGLPLVN